MERLRVLLVDDSHVFAEEAEAILSASAEIEFVAWSPSAPEALELLSRVPVDVVLMDIAMPGTSGIDATRSIKARRRAPRVVMLSLHDGPEYRDAARVAGADGFLSKSELDKQAIETLLRVCRGGP